MDERLSPPVLAERLKGNLRILLLQIPRSDRPATHVVEVAAWNPLVYQWQIISFIGGIDLVTAQHFAEAVARRYRGYNWFEQELEMESKSGK